MLALVKGGRLLLALGQGWFTNSLRHGAGYSVIKVLSLIMLEAGEEHHAAGCMVGVKEASFWVGVFPFLNRIYVSAQGSEQSAVHNAFAPVVRGVLFGPEGQDLGKAFLKEGVNEVKARLVRVELQPCRSGESWKSVLDWRGHASP